MTPQSDSSQSQLRIVRYFLPRLTKEQLAREIDEERARVQAAHEHRLSELQRTARECSDRESAQQRGHISELEGRLGSQKALSVCMAIVAGAAAVYAVIDPHAGARAIGIAAGVLGGLTFVILLARVAALGHAVQEELRSMLAQAEHQLTESLGRLDAKLDELLAAYNQSVAVEDEVMHFVSQRLDELREQVFPALGLVDEDVLDNRCAEVWAPTFLQTQSLPRPVQQDIEASERDILDMRDSLIEPMKSVFREDQQWSAFRSRILPLLGLSDVADGDEREDDAASVRLNAAAAIRFSERLRAYLSGHYFYQKILCAREFIGLFRAFVNILSQRIPFTYSFHIMYTDVAAIGIETAQNLEHYKASRMTIDQHTHTLALELTSGTTCRMSGDAGSTGWVQATEDVGGAQVRSAASEAFRDQISNVRALIKDAKAARVGVNGLPA